MNSPRLISTTVLAWILTCAPSHAHFLFIHITPPAEAGRAAEVYFSERAQAGDPRFLSKIGAVQLWLQDAPGHFQPLKIEKGADRWHAHLPTSGSIAVVGSCEYGVVSRLEKTPFLLRYYPRALAGKPAELNRLQPFGKVPLEIVATITGDQIDLLALLNGKPVPKAEFQTVAGDLSNETITADALGHAKWKPSAPGRYSVYVRHVTREPGNLDGRKYDEVREFATLAFSWPMDRSSADPEAVAMFQEALSTRAQWKNFPGFNARVTGTVDGRSFTGKATVSADGNVQLALDDAASARWVKGQLESMAMHRGAGEDASARDQPKPRLHFAEAQDDHPLGRLLIFEGGEFASSYRVKDKQITVVNRGMGRRLMTITVLDNQRNADGSFLPRTYTVQYWDAATGALQRAETVHDQWRRVGSWDLPVSHLVTVASDTGLGLRTLYVTDHQLLPKIPAKAASR